MEYKTTNTDIHYFWSYKFRQKERNKPSDELMLLLKSDYPNIESWSSQDCVQAMRDYQDLQANGVIPPTVIPVPRTR